jgi:glycosyltransferase involved in cell wall biosynthesis
VTDSRPVITLDYTPAFEQGGGIGRYVRELVSALTQVTTVESPRFRLFVQGCDPSTLPLDVPFASHYEWRGTRLTPRALARIWQRARLPLPVEIFAGRAALYHATDFVLPPTLPGTRTLLTVHDLSFVRVPETAAPRLKRYLDAAVPRSVARADHILADSEATRRDLIDLYRVPESKVTVLLSGVDPRFTPSTQPADRLRARYHLPDRPYILSVGTVQPRKNYGRLIEALAALRRAGHDVDLVIVGGKGWLEDPIYAMIRDQNVADHVHFTGFADEADLPALYTHAAVFAFPSLYEGFGLPVLESMGCGTPVVTSTVSSLPEVAGDAALMVDPLDVTGLTDALQRLLTDHDLRAELVRRGHERVQSFTWTRAARQLLAIYDEVLRR